MPSIILISQVVLIHRNKTGSRATCYLYCIKVNQIVFYNMLKNLIPFEEFSVQLQIPQKVPVEQQSGALHGSCITAAPGRSQPWAGTAELVTPCLSPEPVPEAFVPSARSTACCSCVELYAIQTQLLAFLKSFLYIQTIHGYGCCFLKMPAFFSFADTEGEGFHFLSKEKCRVLWVGA